jgi:hypothetical protein
MLQKKENAAEKRECCRKVVAVAFGISAGL